MVHLLKNIISKFWICFSLKDAFFNLFHDFQKKNLRNKKSTKVPVPPNWPYVNQLIAQLHFFKIIGEQKKYQFEEGDFFIQKVAPKNQIRKKTLSTLDNWRICSNHLWRSKNKYVMRKLPQYKKRNFLPYKYLKTFNCNSLV